ncbi:Spermidine/putrescine transport system permease protein PotB [bacterium HR12]|nr:Spermidine/putrescine transport system permease protein PotB [bacterium HR12]
MADTRRIPGGRRFGLILSAAPALWLLAFFVVPLAILVAWSFQPPGIVAALRPVVTLEAYRSTLSASSYWRVLARTGVIALTVAAVAVVLAYPIAYTLAFAARRRRNLVLTLALLPFLTSYLLRIYAWRLLLGTKGVLNGFLQAIGLIERPLPFFLYSRTAVVLVLIYVWVPWAALPIFLRLEQMDRTLIEAADDLGATRFRAFLRVTLPLSMPGVFAAFFFVMIPTLGDFATASAVGGSGGQMIGNIIQQYLNSLSYPSGAVLSVLLLATALLAMAIGAKLAGIRDVGDVRV